MYDLESLNHRIKVEINKDIRYNRELLNKTKR